VPRCAYFLLPDVEGRLTDTDLPTEAGHGTTTLGLAQRVRDSAYAVAAARFDKQICIVCTVPRETPPDSDATSRSNAFSVAVLDITVVVINFNGGDGLIKTLASLRAQEGVRLRILVYDDGSTDGSPQAAESSRLADEIHVSEVNTKNANRWRSAGLDAAQTDLVLVTDNDVCFPQLCLFTLAETFTADATIAAVTPAIQHRREEQVVPYSSGNKLHYLGLTTRLPAGEPQIRDSIGTGITMYSKSRLGRIGGYDPAFQIGWGDDFELHFRLQLAGMRSVVNLGCLIDHDFKPFDSTRNYRVKNHTHNRLRFVYTHYSLGTIVYLAPLLALFEVIQCLYFVCAGMGRQYRGGWRLLLQSRPELMFRRRFIQSLRVRQDRELLFAGKIYLPPHFGERFPLIRSLVERANLLLRLYWLSYVLASGGISKARQILRRHRHSATAGPSVPPTCRAPE
jgi:GT2 family glycosyltransferase